MLPIKRDCADEVAVIRPGHILRYRIGCADAVALVAVLGDDRLAAQRLDHPDDGFADIGVPDAVCVRDEQDLEFFGRLDLLVLALGAETLKKHLRLLRRLIGAFVDRLLDLEVLCHLVDGFLLGVRLSLPHTVKEEPDIALAESVGDKVSLRHEACAHLQLVPERHARYEDHIALSYEPVHMPEQQFDRQAGLVNGEHLAARQNRPVRLGTDDVLHADLREEGRPEFFVLIPEHCPGDAHFHLTLQRRRRRSRRGQRACRWCCRSYDRERDRCNPSRATRCRGYIFAGTHRRAPNSPGHRAS